MKGPVEDSPDRVMLPFVILARVLGTLFACSSMVSQCLSSLSCYKSVTLRIFHLVLGKLIARGYQPHLEELLLRLNFNAFYLH